MAGTVCTTSGLVQGRSRASLASGERMAVVELDAATPTIAALAVMHAERTVLRNPPAGFFPTPQECALAMARRLDLWPGLTVLDPSGGIGSLLDACRFLCPEAMY